MNTLDDIWYCYEHEGCKIKKNCPLYNGIMAGHNPTLRSFYASPRYDGLDDEDGYRQCIWVNVDDVSVGWDGCKKRGINQIEMRKVKP